MNKTYDNELLRIVKYGNEEDVREYMEAHKKESYPEDFTVFMSQMLEQYKKKRNEVAVQAGLSEGYTYKILNGAKVTTERDYILAICIVIGMNIPQTQHALNIYGMPMLDRSDVRSNLIYCGIDEKCSIDKINVWLEKAGQELIKTSTDMPSAKIKIHKKTADEITAPAKERHEYKEIGRSIWAEHCGEAPMDFNYNGIITIQNDIGKKYFVGVGYTIHGVRFIVFNEEQYKNGIQFIEKEQEFNEGDCSESGNPEKRLLNLLISEVLGEDGENTTDVMEQYDSLINAAESDFFMYFLELDHATDDVVIETMNYIDDTRNFGRRVGAKIYGGHRVCYLEYFNKENPAEREYFQVIQDNEELSYSASHESCFMRLELGEIYETYFGEKHEPEFYVSVKDTNELMEDNLRLKFIFDELRLYLHRYVKERFGGLFNIEDKVIQEETMNALAQSATALMQNDRYSEALKELLQLAQITEDADKQGEDLFIPLAITYGKIANMYEMLGDMDGMNEIYDKIYLMRDRIPKMLESNPKEAEEALHFFAEVMLQKAQDIEKVNGPYGAESKALLKEVIDLLGERSTLEESFKSLLIACTKYAFTIDGEDPETAAKYYKKAISIVNAYGFEQHRNLQRLIVTLYNNYAWVLWNVFGNEEAVIYYGRAIELLESYAVLRSQDEKYIHDEFVHVGGALYKLYLAANKEKEARNLKERLSENGAEV